MKQRAICVMLELPLLNVTICASWLAFTQPCCCIYIGILVPYSITLDTI